MNIFKNIKKDYVSFDIFDTLLYRQVERPDEIFKIVEEKLQKIDKKDFENFYKKRVEAQKRAESSNKVEATINDIYDLMDIKKEYKEIALETEIETEIQNLYPNVYLNQQIRILRNEGKKIIIISDMYLTKNIIERILNENKIQYDYLYVSSEVQLRKSSGKLFEYVMNDLHINSKNIIHIGDNFKSDYIMAKLRGIKAFRWKREKSQHINKLQTVDEEDAKELYKILNSHKSYTLYEKIGFELFGPLLLGFCQWIENKRKNEKLDGLCFLSRDGQIVKKAYDKIYRNNYPYFLASRRTLTVPLLTKAKSMKDIIEIVPYIKREENVDSFLKKIGIESAKIEDEIIKLYGEEINRSTLLSEQGYKLFEIIKDEMYESSKREMEAAKRYIEENLPKGKIGLVDIGWYGTMQKSLLDICKKEGFNSNYSFYGLYLGLLKKNNVSIENASGYVYDCNEEEIFDSSLIFGFNGLIELMFTASHGSASKYILNNDKSECILEEEKGEYSEFVREVQDGALDFIEYIVENSIDLNISTKMAYICLEDLLVSPSLVECNILGDLYFYDAYFEKIIQFECWRKIISNPKKSFSKFMKSNWKIGFIKEMFPGLNSFKIYKMIKR